MTSKSRRSVSVDGVSVVKSPLSSIGNLINKRCDQQGGLYKENITKTTRTSVDHCIKENEAGHSKEMEDDDDEIFFGIITDKERCKMTKLRRKTQLFVTNFRDASYSDTDSLADSHMTNSSCDSLQLSHDSNHRGMTSDSTGPGSPTGQSSQLACRHLSHQRYMTSSASWYAGSPSIAAHQAAAKIQSWFRLLHQAQTYQGVMKQVKDLEDETEDFMQEIRREKERIRLCSTPRQDEGTTHRGEKVNEVSGSPVVIVPSHIPCVVETSPQQHTGVISLQESDHGAKISYEPTGSKEIEIVFNATDDKITTDCKKMIITTHQEPTLSDGDSSLSDSTPATLQVATLESSVIPSPCLKEDIHVGVHDQSTSYSALNLDNAKSNTQTLSASTERHPYNGAYSPTASKLEYGEKTESCVSTGIPGINEGTMNSPLHMRVGQSPAYNPLMSLSLSHLMISIPKIDSDLIQSPKVFSSPRLFPMTVQAVQSQQSIPSAVLFSPHRITQKSYQGVHLPVKSPSLSFNAQDAPYPKPADGTLDQSCHSLPDLLQTESDSKHTHSVMPIPSLNKSSLSEDYLHSYPNTSYSSQTLNDYPLSPNISVRKSVREKVAVVKPHFPMDQLATPKLAAEHGGESGYQTTLRSHGSNPELHSNISQQLASSYKLFQSPVVMVKGTQELMTSSLSVVPHQQESAPVHTGCMPSPHTRRNEAARRKLELLEQKKADLARIRAEKAQLKQTLKTENEMCFNMKQEVQSALRSNMSRSNIPVHLLSLGCQGISSLTLSDQELDIVTRLHTIRNSHQEGIPACNVSSPRQPHTSNKGSLHLRWHSGLVTEVHHLSSPSHPVRGTRPILTKHVGKGRQPYMTYTASSAQRMNTRQHTGTAHQQPSHAHTPKEKLGY